MNDFKLILTNSKSRSVELNESVYERGLRLLGNTIAYAYYKLNLTANSLTATGIIIEFIGCGHIVLNQYLIGSGLLFLGVVIDYADGTVARTRNEVGKIRTAWLCGFHHYTMPVIILMSAFISLNEYGLGLISVTCCAITFQLLSFRSRNLFKYKGKKALKTDKLGTNNKLFKLMVFVSEAPTNLMFLTILLLKFNPVLFILLYLIWMPIRMVGFWIFGFIEHKV